MPINRTARILGVLAFVAGLGAVAGLVTGVLAMLLLLLRDGFLGPSDYLTFAALAGAFGAAVGIVFGPALALTLLRSVPLGRAALVPALASSAGVALVVALEIDTILFYGIPIAFAGAAAIGLRLEAKRERHAKALPDNPAPTTARLDGAS